MTSQEAEHLRKLLKEFTDGMRSDLAEIDDALSSIREQADRAIISAKKAEANSQEMREVLCSVHEKIDKVNTRVTRLTEEFAEQITNSADRKIQIVKQETNQDLRIAVLEAELKKKHDAENRSVSLKSGTISGILAGAVTTGIVQAVQYLLSTSRPMPTLLHWLTPWWWGFF